MKVEELPPVLQLDQGGNPHGWISYQDSAYYYAKNLVSWSMGEVEFDLRGGTNAKTGEQSRLTINTIVAIKGEVSAKRMEMFNRTPLTNKALFRRDHNICAYCGEVFVTAQLTRDHIVPRSKGGPDVWENVVTSCGKCNKAKDNKMLENTNMELLYVPYAPNRAEFLILSNRRILADQMEFLLKRVPANSRVRDLVA
jgi:hypothetical protein